MIIRNIEELLFSNLEERVWQSSQVALNLMHEQNALAKFFPEYLGSSLTQIRVGWKDNTDA